MKKLVWILFLCTLSAIGYAQKNISDTTIRFFAISGQFGIQTPFGDIADRFGTGGIAGGSFLYKSKSNLTLEGNFGFIFGNNIKEDSIFRPLMTAQGIMIGRDGNPGEAKIFQRGFLITGRIGKIIPIIGPNPNSGLHLAVGGGFMQHKIKIEDTFESIPQLAGEYKKGYDRLTFGPTLSQSIGYQHFSSYRYFNFYIGMEFYEGFTQNRRTINFDTGKPDNRQRIDVIGTFVVRWYFPMYKRQPSDYYFY